MGNDLSLAGNLVLFTCMLGGLFLPIVLKKWAPALISPDNWWVLLPGVAAAVSFYFISLNLAAPDCVPAARTTDGFGGRKRLMNSQTDAIRITGLVKQYGNVTAVDNLSLRVPAGIMFGFLGPNGSGKSTTIGCLTGLLDPTSGEIEILGERFSSEASSLKRRMGVMPETLGLFEPLYAHEFLAFIARMYGLDEETTQKPRLRAAGGARTHRYLEAALRV